MGYTIHMGMRYIHTAFKHGLTEREIAYVYSHAIDQIPFTDRHGDPAMKFLGPVHAQTNRLAEVFVKQSGGDFIIFHAMETGERA